MQLSGQDDPVLGVGFGFQFGQFAVIEEILIAVVYSLSCVKEHKGWS